VHLFRRELGLSLRKYAQTLKLQAAAAYLRRGVTLTEVAAVAGFADSAHFSKLWKQHFGFPPQRAFSGEEVSIDPLPWPPCTHEAPPPHRNGMPS
jgi:AraC-like DNA-binding protein